MKASNSTIKRILQMLVMLSSLFIGSAAVADGSTNSAIYAMHHLYNLDHASTIGLAGSLTLTVSAFLVHLVVLFVCERSGLLNTLLISPRTSRA